MYDSLFYKLIWISAGEYIKGICGKTTSISNRKYKVYCQPASCPDICQLTHLQCWVLCLLVYRSLHQKQKKRYVNLKLQFILTQCILYCPIWPYNFHNLYGKPCLTFAAFIKHRPLELRCHVFFFKGTLRQLWQQWRYQFSVRWSFPAMFRVKVCF